MECPSHNSDRLIGRYVRDEASREEEVQAEELFATCARCDQLRAAGRPGTGDPDAPPSEGPRQGDVFAGRYLLVRVLGSGGFAPVWEAQDLASRRMPGPHPYRRVAVKVVPDSVKVRLYPVAGDFARLQALDHPSVMKAEGHGFDPETRCHYLVCQFIDGTPLSEMVRDGGVEHTRVLRWAEKIAQALEYVHARGLIHFDVKPANVLIVDGLHPVLIDFGVSAHRDTAWTNWGAGTRLYMSPEHLRHPGGRQKPDGRSDVWGVGVILYELLTGRRPFEKEDQVGATDPVPLEELRPDVPAWVGAIWRGCLKRDPGDRYTSRQLREAIAAGLLPGRLRRAAAWALLALAALALVWGAVSWSRALPPEWRTVEGLPATIHDRQWLVLRVTPGRPVAVEHLVRIDPGGRLRIEGHGAIRFARGAGIHAQGRLAVSGTSGEEPLHFRRSDPLAGWAGVRLVGEDAAGSRLRHVRFEGGGGALCDADDPRAAGGAGRPLLRFPSPDEEGARTHGGALLLAATRDVRISDAHFTGNRARRGGAVFIFDSQNIDFHECLFAGNETEFEPEPRTGTAPPAGGAVFTQLAERVWFTGCRFLENRAPSRHACGGAAYGGVRSVLQFRGCDFIRNQSGHAGGALYLASFGRAAGPGPADRGDAPGPTAECVVKEACLFEDNLAGFWHPSDRQRRPQKFGQGKAIYVDQGVELRLRGATFVQALLTEPVVAVDGVPHAPSRFTLEDCRFRVGRDGATLADVCHTPNAGRHDAVTIPPGANEVLVSSPVRETPLRRGFVVPDARRVIDTVVVQRASALHWDRGGPGTGLDAARRASFLRENPDLAQVRGRERDYHPEFVKAAFEAADAGPHYLVARDGRILRLAAEGDVASHAGVGRMPARFDPEERDGVDRFSIGVGLIAIAPRDDDRVSPEAGLRTTADGQEPAYTYAQHEALRWLLRDIGSRHPVKAVVGHDEIARPADRPVTQSDPGTHFNWANVREENGRPLP